MILYDKDTETVQYADRAEKAQQERNKSKPENGWIKQKGEMIYGYTAQPRRKGADCQNGLDAGRPVAGKIYRRNISVTGRAGERRAGNVRLHGNLSRPSTYRDGQRHGNAFNRNLFV